MIIVCRQSLAALRHCCVDFKQNNKKENGQFQMSAKKKKLTNINAKQSKSEEKKFEKKEKNVRLC